MKFKALFGVAGIAGCLAAAGCTTAIGGRDEISEKVAARLAQFERTGEMESCLSPTRIRSMTALDDYRFLVTTSGGGTYLNEVSGRCSGAGDFGNRIQYELVGGQLCRNQIIRIVDNTNGFTVGSCGLSSFEKLAEVETPEDGAGNGEGDSE